VFERGCGSKIWLLAGVVVGHGGTRQQRARGGTAVVRRLTEKKNFKMSFILLIESL
jgi:hypothetical protein